MRTAVNLIPMPTLKQFACWRLVRRWSAIWGVGSLVLLIGYLYTCQAVQRAQASLAAAHRSTDGIRQAHAETQSLIAQTLKLKQSVETAQRLEQSDAPLALLQVIAQCCQQVQPAARLSSLRMSELISVDSNAAKNGKSFQPISTPRKHLLITGVAQADACLNLVSELRATAVFRNVELMSSQSTSEQKLAEQSFQIRCEQ